MASVTVRDIPEETKRKLAARAAEAGLSLEAFLRWLFEVEAGRKGHRVGLVEGMRRIRKEDGWREDDVADYLNETSETYRAASDRRDDSPFEE